MGNKQGRPRVALEEEHPPSSSSPSSASITTSNPSSSPSPSSSARRASAIALHLHPGDDAPRSTRLLLLSEGTTPPRKTLTLSQVETSARRAAQSGATASVRHYVQSTLLEAALVTGVDPVVVEKLISMVSTDDWTHVLPLVQQLWAYPEIHVPLTGTPLASLMRDVERIGSADYVATGADLSRVPLFRLGAEEHHFYVDEAKGRARTKEKVDGAKVVRILLIDSARKMGDGPGARGGGDGEEEDGVLSSDDEADVAADPLSEILQHVPAVTAIVVEVSLLEPLEDNIARFATVVNFPSLLETAVVLVLTDINEFGNAHVVDGGNRESELAAIEDIRQRFMQTSQVIGRTIVIVQDNGSMSILDGVRQAVIAERLRHFDKTV